MVMAAGTGGGSGVRSDALFAFVFRAPRLESDGGKMLDQIAPIKALRGPVMPVVNLTIEGH